MTTFEPTGISVIDDPTTRSTDIRPAVIRDSIRIVNDSGVLGLLNSWRTEDGADPASKPGAKAAISDEAILALLVSAALLKEPLTVENIAGMLTQGRLKRKSQESLDIDMRKRRSESAWYQQCWRAMHRVLAPMDPYPETRRLTLTKAEFDEILAREDSSEVERKRARLAEFSDALMQTTVNLIPVAFLKRWKGDTAVDATLAPVLGQRGTTASSEWVSSDPRASWYVRDGDHDGAKLLGDASSKPATRRKASSKYKRKHSKVVWGYELTTVVMTADTSPDAGRFPLLIGGVRLHKPGHDPAGEALGVYRSLHRAGYEPGIIVGDRLYGGSPDPAKWQVPLRRMGYRLVHDYTINQLGVQRSFGGMIQVEGDWYSPSMPEALINATREYRAGEICKQDYLLRIEQRKFYRFQPKGKLSEDGYQRFMCPATGPNATLRCPLKEFVRTRAARHGTRVVPESEVPSMELPVCMQDSITVPVTEGIKLAVDIPYGTPEWYAAYTRPRQTVESWNGHLKSGTYANINDPHRRAMRGFAAQFVLLTAMVAAANILKLAAWLKNHDDDAVVDPTPKKRRRDEAWGRRTTRNPAALTTPPPVESSDDLE